MMIAMSAVTVAVAVLVAVKEVCGEHRRFLRAERPDTGVENITVLAGQVIVPVVSFSRGGWNRPFRPAAARQPMAPRGEESGDRTEARQKRSAWIHGRHDNRVGDSIIRSVGA